MGCVPCGAAALSALHVGRIWTRPPPPHPSLRPFFQLPLSLPLSAPARQGCGCTVYVEGWLAGGHPPPPPLTTAAAAPPAHTRARAHTAAAPLPSWPAMHPMLFSSSSSSHPTALRCTQGNSPAPCPLDQQQPCLNPPGSCCCCCSAHAHLSQLCQPSSTCRIPPSRSPPTPPNPLYWGWE